MHYSLRPIGFAVLSRESEDPTGEQPWPRVVEHWMCCTLENRWNEVCSRSSCVAVNSFPSELIPPWIVCSRLGWPK